MAENPKTVGEPLGSGFAREEGWEPTSSPRTVEGAWIRALVTAFPDALVLLDEEGRILDANDPARRVLGEVSRGRVLEKTLRGAGVVDPREISAFRSLEGSDRVAVEMRLGSGKPQRFLVEAHPVRLGGRFLGRIVRFRSRQGLARSARESRSLVDVQRRALVLALEETQGNITETARRLGVTRPTVYNMIRRYEITPTRPRTD